MARSRRRGVWLAVPAFGWALALIVGQASGGVVGSPHDFADTVTTPQHPTRSGEIAPSGACSACHIAHGADSYAIWSRNLQPYRDRLTLNGGSRPDYVNPPTIQCYDCHDYHNPQNENPLFDPLDNVPAFSNFATDHKPQNVAFGFSTSATPKDSFSTMKEDQPAGSLPGYYENKPPHSSDYGADPNLNPADNASLYKTGGHYFKRKDPTGTVDEFDIGDKLPCRDCHDPHEWNTGWQAFIRKSWPTSAIANYLGSTATASPYMANAPISGTRDTAGGGRKLCIACHGTSDPPPGGREPVKFGDISAGYSSSTGLDNLPAAVAEHRSDSATACVSCHNHNSVDASCGECHGFPPSDTASPAYPQTATSAFVPAPNPGANDSHPKHYGAKAGQTRNSQPGYVYAIDCRVCHYGSAMGIEPTLGHHQNARVSVVIQGIWTKSPNGPAGAFDNTNYYNQDKGFPPAYTGQLDNQADADGWGHSTRYGWNSCRNVYCHSAGRVQASMALDCTVDYPRPAWNGGPQRCNSCHGFGTDNTTAGGLYYGMPNYPPGTAGSDTANSHRRHLDEGIECYVCHADTADNTATRASRAIKGAVPTRHVDRLRQVVFGSGASGTYDNNPATKTCHVSCHGAGNPQWGGTLAGACFACHGGAEQLYKPQDDYGTAGAANPVDNNEYLHSGHGRAGSNYLGSNNLPAGFDNAAGSPSACYVCHAQSAPHTLGTSANDPFRLGHASDGTLGGFGGTGGFTGAWADNTDALCLGCHGNSTQRSGHDNAAEGTTTVDAQTHARALMPSAKYNWPVTPWKCVDCHDPHGDGRSGGADRYMMVRSGINAPSDNTDGNAGSDAKSRPKRTDANVRSVSFNSLAGYSTTAGVYSYANQGNGTGGTWGPCEVCHTQTNAYSRTLDNAATHASRTTRCTACHPHTSGFAPTACKGCHGPDSVAPTAPDVGAYWSSSGHGKFQTAAPLPVRAVECEDCHDTGYLTGLDHKTNVAGTPPNNINTETWPGKGPLTSDTAPNVNTSHLKSGFIATNPADRAAVARKFDNFCADTTTGCHNADYHRHQLDNGPNPRDVMRFGDKNTIANPKTKSWYTLSNYPVDFYKSQSPWIDNDISATALSDNTSYGLCVSCHDPHGVDNSVVTDTSFYPGLGTTNHMMRGNWRTDSNGFCNKACHTK